MWLLKEYTIFEKEVGPNSLFRTKNALYKYLSEQIQFVFGTKKTEQQILNRVQTINRQRIFATAANVDLVSINGAGAINTQPRLSRPLVNRTTGVVKPSVQWPLGQVQPPIVIAIPSAQNIPANNTGNLKHKNCFRDWHLFF